MIEHVLYQYKEAYVKRHFEKMSSLYNEIQNIVVAVCETDVVVFFKNYCTYISGGSNTFFEDVLGNKSFSNELFYQKAENLINVFDNKSQLIKIYDLLLYPPDLFLKTILHYEPMELLSLRHYPDGKSPQLINLSLNSYWEKKVCFYVTEYQTNYPDVLIGRALPHNGNHEDFVYDYHLPLTILFANYLKDAEVIITGDYSFAKSHKYIYNLTLRNAHVFFNKYKSGFLKVLPENVLNDLKNDKCIVIFNSIHESFNFSVCIHSLVKALKSELPDNLRENVVFLTGNSYDLKALSILKKRIPFITKNVLSIYKNLLSSVFDNKVLNQVNIQTFDFFEEVMAFQSNYLNAEYSLSDRINNFSQSRDVKHFICLNRVVKDFRLATSYLFYKHGLLSKTFLSQNSVTDFRVLKTPVIKPYLGKDFSTFLNTLPYHTDSSTLSPNFWNLYPKELLKMTFVWVVTETLFGNKTESIRTPFLTEKTFKPIMLYMPFVIIGNYKTLESLKKMGYKTFDHWWDESYDIEPNPGKRLTKVFDTLKHIATFTPNDMNTMLLDMKDVLEHNKRVLLSRNTGKQFVNEISKKINV